MIYILVAIKDRALDAFNPIFCVRAEGEAIRNFQDAINNPENKALHNHADDYDLYRVGTFDDSTGEVRNEIKQLAIGKQLKIG